MEMNSVLRHVLQFVAGTLVTKGYLDASMVEIFVGALTGLATLGWYWYQKAKA
jgi:hypothetical protein